MFLKKLKVELPYGEGSDTLLQYSCLENPMDGGAWWAAVHGVSKEFRHNLATGANVHCGAWASHCGGFSCC